MNWSYYQTLDPFRELGRLQREVNRLFDGYAPGDSLSQFPLVNVWGTSDEVVVTAEIPGVDPARIELSVVKNQLTIQGERKSDEPGEEVVCHRAERGTGSFVRTIWLPFEVEDGKTSAKYDKGVLTVTLPRAEATKPRKVQIETA